MTPKASRGRDPEKNMKLRTARAFLPLALAFLVAPLAADAQQVGKTYRIGVLASGPVSPTSPFVAIFQQGLADLGYVEGRNLTIEWRHAGGKAERYDDLATELVGLKVDVILAPNPAAVFAAKRATTTIPIVMGHTPA